MREGFFTNNDETKNSGSVRNRQPPSAGAGPLEAAIPAGSLNGSAAIVVPSTQQARHGLRCSSAAAAGRTCPWVCHAIALTGGGDVGRTWHASWGAWIGVG